MYEGAGGEGGVRAEAVHASRITNHAFTTNAGLLYPPLSREINDS
jgi:hypothetical protein